MFGQRHPINSREMEQGEVIAWGLTLSQLIWAGGGILISLILFLHFSPIPGIPHFFGYLHALVPAAVGAVIAHLYQPATGLDYLTYFKSLYEDKKIKRYIYRK